MVQVSASVSGSWQAVQIIRADGHRAADIRPLVRLNVSVVVSQDGRMESGSSGAGGRVMFDAYMQPEIWQAQVREALRIATVNLGIGAGSRRRDGNRAWVRLAWRHAARGGGPRA